MMLLSNAAIFLFTACLSFSSAADVLSCPDVLGSSAQIFPSATLYYAVVPSNPTGSGNGILCGRLEVISDGWIGLGFSKDGKMEGSESIVGLPGGDVSKYDLSGYKAKLLPDSQQTLTNTSCSGEDGKFNMTFTKLLVEGGEVPILEDGANIFLYAKGETDEVGYHISQKAFIVDFTPPADPSDDVEDGDNEPSSEEPSPAPVANPTEQPVTSAKDCSTDFCENQLSPDYLLRYKINVPTDTTEEECEGCSISMELIYDGEVWVSIGSSLDDLMAGSEAVIGSPDFGPQKYFMSSKDPDGSGVYPMPESQQTLTDTSVVVTDGQTIMKFTKNIREIGEIEINTGNNKFLWAYGTSSTLGFHAARSVFELNLASGVSEEVTVAYKSAWFAHGIMAFLAWGVLVPFAVQAALLRSLLPKGPVWLNLHRALNLSAYAFFGITFIVAVVYTLKEKGAHFANAHQRMGLAMFILALAQNLGGYFRPHNPASGEEKTKLRRGWEIGHRVLGVALLVCGFWQINSGIELFSMRYSISKSKDDIVTTVYWAWIGIMSAVILLGGGYFKYRNPASSKASDNETPAAVVTAHADDAETPLEGDDTTKK